MSITIGNISFDGPHHDTAPLLAKSGVYAILGRSTNGGNWIVVDIGESGDIKNRVATHDRQEQWRRCGHTSLSVAAYYCDGVTRMQVEKALRQSYNPPCGDR